MYINKGYSTLYFLKEEENFDVKYDLILFSKVGIWKMEMWE
jgi:hypothetical protein